jgi:hypothetical protein
MKWSRIGRENKLAHFFVIEAGKPGGAPVRPRSSGAGCCADPNAPGPTALGLNSFKRQLQCRLKRARGLHAPKIPNILERGKGEIELIFDDRDMMKSTFTPFAEASSSLPFSAEGD